jgi:hypothetical protein
MKSHLSAKFKLGIPVNAMHCTVFDQREMLEFLQFDEVESYEDVENKDQFDLYSQAISPESSLSEIATATQKRIIEIFSQENIAKRDEFGYWRMIYTTADGQYLPKSKYKLTDNALGPHYAIEYRDQHSILRAKGRSIAETTELFNLAIKATF